MLRNLGYRKEYKVGNEYKFAIVCSSSKDGDRFKGAGGSTLTVDHSEGICEYVLYNILIL